MEILILKQIGSGSRRIVQGVEDLESARKLLKMLRNYHERKGDKVYSGVDKILSATDKNGIETNYYMVY